MSKKFDKLLEAATDSTNLEPNWDGIIACFDSIRSGEVPAKAAMQSMRKRIQHDNPHVVMHALLVLDACVKNCGHKMHAEIATREFMEEFKNLGIGGQYENVPRCWKCYSLMQCSQHRWLRTGMMELNAFGLFHAASHTSVFKIFYNIFSCRSEFSLFNRKHHCRACGQIFCDRCSTKEIPLPQFGIEKEVLFAVDVCVVVSYEIKFSFRFVYPAASIPVSTELSQAEKDKLLKEKEEEDLALALAISQSEAEAKDQERQKSLYAIYNEMGYKGAAPSVAESPTDALAADDPLARYLNRDYWQQRKAGVEEWAGVSASAPLPSDASVAPSVNAVTSTQAEIAQLSLGQDAKVADDIKFQTEGTLKWCAQLKAQVTVMENRIRSNSARGRSVLNDTAIQGLFSTLTEFHSQVLGALSKLDEERTFHETLQDHLAHISEARLAVDELRAEHERRRHERLAEEQRQRQTQMKQTLEMMRMKKHVMLMEQRNVALQRFQHQEMQARRGIFFQDALVGYVVPGYQGFPQQQYAQTQTGYQQYPNSAVPTNQWQDQATTNHQGFFHGRSWWLFRQLFVLFFQRNLQLLMEISLVMDNNR
uniref:Hepatocyte growth factor-regulated tyrosine kinase substrate n=1 Tax=Angiostrongylus cantonensis TaxID=6313 RepID=A0A0K0DED6_ANGCA